VDAAHRTVAEGGDGGGEGKGPTEVRLLPNDPPSWSRRRRFGGVVALVAALVAACAARAAMARAADARAAARRKRDLASDVATRTASSVRGIGGGAGGARGVLCASSSGADAAGKAASSTTVGVSSPGGVAGRASLGTVAPAAVSSVQEELDVASDAPLRAPSRTLSRAPRRRWHTPRPSTVAMSRHSSQNATVAARSPSAVEGGDEGDGACGGGGDGGIGGDGRDQYSNSTTPAMRPPRLCVAHSSVPSLTVLSSPSADHERVSLVHRRQLSRREQLESM